MNANDMKLLKDFERMSKSLGLRQDYIQGGGGNTSVKLSGGLMAIKASGYKLKDIDAEKGGFAVVNKDNIVEFLNTVDTTGNEDYEKVCSGVVKENIVELPGYAVLKPSVETGFHSVLKTFVAHSHSVYSNILCCSANGKELMDKYITSEGISAVFVPYTMPGFWLTLSIKKAREDYAAANGKDADVVFMENHGVIVCADDADEAVALHEHVNNLLKAAFGCPEFPVVATDYANGCGTSATPWLKERAKNGVVTDEMMNNYLYPDHIAYIAPGDASFENKDAKVYLDAANGTVTYHVGENEAQTMEETIVGLVYVNESIDRVGLPKQGMTPEAISQIANWDAEKYRRSVTSGK